MHRKAAQNGEGTITVNVFARRATQLDNKEARAIDLLGPLLGKGGFVGTAAAGDKVSHDISVF